MYRLSKLKSSPNYVAVALCFIFTLTILFVPIVVKGQVLYGSLTGNISDQKNAVIPGATVEAVNINTGATKTATTDERGNYLFSDLQPGIYKVKVSIASFKSVLREDIRVEANTIARFDTSLETGEVKETVVVTSDDQPLLQTDRGDVNIVQTTRQINDLPLAGSAGRNYQSLMQIVPGSVLAGEQNSAAGSPQRSISFNVNGVSRLQNNTRLDGSSIVYPWLPTNTVYVPPAESIQTVNIVTNSFDAEQGFAGGAAINVIIKSGTNGFHGTGWLYHTNSKLRARNYFQTPSQVNNPKDLLNQFGYNFSGPIFKNKLFFFTGWERTTRRNTGNTGTFTLPTAALRNGDFSGLIPAGTDCNVTRIAGCIYDPASNPNPALRTAFPGNIIPMNRIDLAATELIRRLPLPNGTGFTNNYSAVGVGRFDRDNIDSKINYVVNNKMSIFGRYSLSPTNIFDPPALGDAGGDALNGGQVGKATGFIQVAGMGGTYAFSSNLILDANIGYTYQRLGAENIDIGTNFGLEVLRIPGTNGPDRLQGGIPSFQINGWANLGNPNTGNPFTFKDQQFVVSANLSWLLSAHSMRFGFDYQNQQLNHFQPQGGTFQTVRGTFQFNGNPTALQGGAATNSFNSWASFLLGLPTNAGKVVQLRNPNALRMQTYAIYGRDQWQVNRDLTITYGLRWELYPFPSRDNGIGVSRFDPTDGNVYTGGFDGVPVNTNAKIGIGQFLPRIGVAYRLGNKTVIRGGYGQTADPKPYIDFRNAYPVNFAWAQPAGTFNGVNNGFVPVTTFRIGLQEALYGVAPNINQGVIRLPTTAGTTTFPRESERKVIHSFNFILQRELPWKFVVSLGYVGTRVLGQQGFVNINASAPGTGDAGRPLNVLFGIKSDINSIRPVGDVSYDSMQVDINRRVAKSVLGIVYTWSKAINYQDNDSNPRIPYLPEIERNKGLAGYDRPHNLQIYGVWDLPFGKGQQWANGGILSKIVGGFQLNGIFSATSGTPFYVVQGNGFNLNAFGSGQVPDQIRDVQILGGIGIGNPYFDRTAYSIVNIPVGQPQRFGNAGRNNLRGPSFYNFDLGLFRTFAFGEHLRLQIRAEALNAFNHANFANPQADINNANFGYITSTTGQGSRQFRFAARLSF